MKDLIKGALVLIPCAIYVLGVSAALWLADGAALTMSVIALQTLAMGTYLCMTYVILGKREVDNAVNLMRRCGALIAKALHITP